MVATMHPDAGNHASGKGGEGTAGVAGANTGGAGNAAGTGAGGVGGSAGEGAAGKGGTGGTGAATTSCKPIGFATRDGRTGGEVEVRGGGDTTPVVVSSFAELASLAKDSSPRVIHVDGKLGSGWSGNTGDRLELGSNKTIIGLHPGTELKAPIHIQGATNVIIRNLVIHGPGSNSDQAWDNLNIEGGSKHIWIDHCEFWDGQDGNADVVKGADNVTFTWNIFGYRTGGEHNFSNLVASSDDEPQSEGKLNITLMFNWFTGVAQRQPRCRYGNIHVVNNLFTKDGQKSDYGISAGKDCKVLTEANHFIEINSPIYTSHMSGSSANELRGDNIFEKTSGNTTGYGKAFEPPYDYKQLLVPAADVQSLLKDKVGATLASPSACD
jgi:pectate lyase